MKKVARVYDPLGIASPVCTLSENVLYPATPAMRNVVGTPNCPTS